MGLFNRSKHQDFEIVSKIYREANQEMVASVYYGNENAAYNILHKLMLVLTENKAAADESVYRLCSDVYLQVWIRKHGALSPEFMLTDYIKYALHNKYMNVFREDILDRMIDESILYIYQNEPEIQTRDEYISIIEQTESQNIQKNAETELLNIDNPEYGLRPDMPVFVNGFGSDKEYLSRLRTKSGQELSFNREKSIEILGISGPVDEYSAFTPNNEYYGCIYICNYGSVTSDKAPANFVLYGSAEETQPNSTPSALENATSQIEALPDNAKHFRSVYEYIMYCLEGNDGVNYINIDNETYISFINCISGKESKDELLRFLNALSDICPANKNIYYEISQLYRDTDEEKYLFYINKCLRYCIPETDKKMLQSVYKELETLFFTKAENNVANALSMLSSLYNPESYPDVPEEKAIEYMSGEQNILDAFETVKKSGIQAGYSDLSKKALKTFEDYQSDNKKSD